MPLHDLIGGRQADASPRLLSGEIQFKDFFLNVSWNANALVTNFGDHRALVPEGADGEYPADRHRLDPVQDYVKDRLLGKVDVNLDRDRLRGQFADQLDAMLLRVGSCQQRDFIQHQPQIRVFEVQVAGTSKVHQDLHHAIQPMNLAVTDIHVTEGIRINLFQLVAQQLQVKHDRVDGIFYFVGHPAGDPAAGGNPPRKLDLVLNAAHGFGVAHGQQRANLCALLLNEIERKFDPPTIGHFDFALCNVVMQAKGVQHEAADWRLSGKNFFGVAPQQFAA